MDMFDEKGRLMSVWLEKRKIVEMCREELVKEGEGVKRRD